MSTQLPGFTLKTKIGQGSVAAAYTATQTAFERDVAVKVFAPQLSQQPAAMQRLKQVSQTLASLQHAHIVTVFDANLSAAYPFMAIEHFAKGSLTNRLSAGQLSAKEAIHICSAIARALQHAKEHGLAHGSLRANNVFFRADNTVVVSDFGLSKAALLTGLNEASYVQDLHDLGRLTYLMLTGQTWAQDGAPQLKGSLLIYQSLISGLLTSDASEALLNAGDVVSLIDQGFQANVPLASPAINHTKSSTHSSEAKPAPEHYFETAEVESGGFFSKQYHFSATFSADDYEQFGSQLMRLQEELAVWLEKRQKKAASIKLDIQAHPWIHGRIKDVLAKGRMDNTAFGMSLKKMPVTLRLFDDQDLNGNEFVLSEGPEKKQMNKNPADID